ncbi:MAG: DUF4363 family protein [Oscillospiraceae bacterium]|nr:DUF4363 family protein [Oscillospiraceae bacterium]
MKRLILCIILFIALCALTACSYLYIVSTTSKLLNKVEFVAYSFSEGDFVSALEAAEKADDLWLDFRRRRFLIMDRDNVAEITESLARIRCFAEEPSDSRELAAECRVAAALLRLYWEKQRLNLYNIM